MSDVIVINTESNETKIINHEPFNVYDDKNPLLSQVMPIFDFAKKPVEPAELIARLKVTMKKYGGIGLAANQCGLPYRCFVIADADKVMGFFNPRIVSYSVDGITMKEGCLSFPGLALDIERPSLISIEYENEIGITMKAEIKGVAARCFQHELDHLNGIKFTSHVGKTKLMMAKKKQQKLFKKHARGG